MAVNILIFTFFIMENLYFVFRDRLVNLIYTFTFVSLFFGVEECLKRSNETSTRVLQPPYFDTNYLIMG